jgi:hypothetical protein
MRRFAARFVSLTRFADFSFTVYLAIYVARDLNILISRLNYFEFRQNSLFIACLFQVL